MHLATVHGASRLCKHAIYGAESPCEVSPVDLSPFLTVNKKSNNPVSVRTYAPWGWRPHLLSFPQRSYRKVDKSPDFVWAKVEVPTHQEEMEESVKAQDGRDRKRGHNRSNSEQRMAPLTPGDAAVSSIHGALLLLTHRPAVSIFPVPSPQARTRTPGSSHLISGHTPEERVFSAFHIWVQKGHFTATSQLQATVPPPSLPHTASPSGTHTM